MRCALINYLLVFICASFFAANALSFSVSMPNADHLLDGEQIVLVGVVRDIKLLEKANSNKGDIFEVLLDVTDVLRGKYSYDIFKYVYSTGKSTDSRYIERLAKDHKLVLVLPRDQLSYEAFDPNDHFDMFYPGRGLSFSKDSLQAQKFLKAFGFKYYSRELALKHTLDYVSGIPSISPSGLDINVKSIKHRWQVVGRCKSWFGCSPEQAEFTFTFDKFDGRSINFSTGRPKKTIWDKLKFW